IGLDGTTLAENADGAKVGTLATKDPDAGDSHVYTVSDDRFEVVDGTLKLKDGIALDHEAEATVDVTVTATDTGGLSTSETFTLAVTDVNEGPVAIGLDGATLAENEDGAKVGTLATKGPDAGDTHAYTVSDDRFEVVDGTLKLKDGISLDHEAEPTVDVSITATDTGGLSTSETFTLQVQDVNEAPVDLSLDRAASAWVVSDEDFSTTPEGWQDGGGGAVTGTSTFAGVAVLGPFAGNRTGAEQVSKDFETGGEAPHAVVEFSFVKIDSWDENNSHGQERFTVYVDGEPAFSFAPDGYGSGFGDGADASGSFAGGSWSVTSSGTDANLGGGGWGDRFYSVRVVLDEPGEGFSLGLGANLNQGINDESWAIADLTVVATDDPDYTAADGLPDRAAPLSEADAGAEIGTLSVGDPDAGDSHVYTVSDDRFEVVDGTLKLKDGVSLDHEAADTVEITVTATDSGGLTTSETFAIPVSDVNEAPVAIGLDGASVTENDAGAKIGTLTAKDADAGDSHGYTVSDDRFEVIDGTLKLKDGVSLDHETEASVDVTVTATDSGGLSVSETFRIAVDDVAEDTTAATPKLALGSTSRTVFSETFEAWSGLPEGSPAEHVSAQNGWNSDGAVELRSEGAGGNGSGPGSLQHVELNTDPADYFEDAPNLARSVDTSDGATYTIRFDYAPRPGFDASVNRMEVVWDGRVVATVSADGSDHDALSWQTHSLTVTGDGDPAEIEFREAGVDVDGGRGMMIDNIEMVEVLDGAARGEAGAAIDLPGISAGLTDLDGSETLAVTIAALPEGTVLSDGTHSFTASAGDTAADVTGWNLDALSLTPPEGFAGTMELSVTATSTESDGGATASTTLSMPVTVDGDDPPEGETIRGDYRDDRLTGTAGGDSIDGGSGNDVIDGGAGDDRIIGLDGNDTIDGGDGDDHIDGGSNHDRIAGGAGDDTIIGLDGNDTIDGGDGDDTIDGGSNHDQIAGGAGDDTIIGRDGNDTIDGGDGDDLIDAGDGNDDILGIRGNDTIDGGTGNDLFELDAPVPGDDWTAEIAGGWGRDTLDLSNLEDWTVVTEDGKEYDIETIDELDRGNDPLSGSVFIDDQEVATFEDIEKFSW
ncbi:MAG: hypothetical protein NXH83_19045, partial [Rhodobacteraceae bacterium]|nr:hypothetical protein [Paracoccaceae bacterium]